MYSEKNIKKSPSILNDTSNKQWWCWSAQHNFVKHKSKYSDI